jgi:replicative DNA helicase
MTTHSEDVLYASLSDIDALETLARRGLDLECVPTEPLRPMVAWALDYYFDSGRRQAPSREFLLATWGETLEEEEVELPDEDIEIDTIESAIDSLKDLYAGREWQTFIKDASTRMAQAPVTTKVEMLAEVTNELFTVSARLQDRSNRALASEGFTTALAAYERRVEEGSATKGITFGLPQIDEHTGGVHPGEMAVVAAGPKVGKSYFLDRVAKFEWAEQGNDFCLFTLENSVEMTLDRIVCLHLGINPRHWQRGTVDEEQVQQVRKFIHEVLPDMPGQLHIIAPPRGSRTPEMMIREAKMLGVQRVAIDQLTHVEHPNPGRKPRHELFNENVHELSDLIKDGRDPIALLLAHQINRAGMEAAKKQDYHEMQHLAESAGVERAANWVFALHQNQAERINKVAKFQILAARREDIKNWQIIWDPEHGSYRVRHEITVGD